MGGGIALTRQVVTTHGPGAPMGCGFWGAGVWQGCVITSHSRNGEKGRKAAGTGAGREHKPLCASHVPVQPRTAPVTSSPAPPRSLITSYLMTNQEELNALLAFPPLNSIPQQMVISNGSFAQDTSSPSPRVFLSALHTLNAPRQEVTQRTPFVCQHNLLFCSKGGRDNWSCEALP